MNFSKKLHTSLILSLLIFLAAISVSNAATDSLQTKKVAGVNVNYVLIDLPNGNYELGVSTANNGLTDWEAFSSQIKRNNAIIACNGNFFSSYRAPREFYGTIYSNGEQKGPTGSLGGIAFDSNNKPMFFEFTQRENHDMLRDNDVHNAVSGDPVTVYEGKNAVGQFKTTRNDLDVKAARTNMGFTDEGKLIIATSRSASIRDMGNVMVALGAKYAVNLDGGASSALYYRGKMVTPPGRNLNVVFYVKSKDVPQPAKTNQLNASKNIAGFMFKGNKVPVAAYNINNNNYVQLRDMASLLNGSKAQFDIKWNNDTKSIELVTGQSYTGDSEDITKLANKAQATESKFSIYVNGKAIDIKGYLIEGRSYFKLRELGEQLNFNVNWNAEDKIVEIAE